MRARVSDFEGARDRFRAAIAAWERATGKRELRILEAGGGSLSHVPFARPHRITVVDISAEQLAGNTEAAEKILGDLHTVDIAPRAYDAVVCYDVIEHLHDPGPVLAKLFAAVAPGGLAVLAAPNPRSLTGLVTKHTPLWFHELVIRRALGSDAVHRPVAFPTYYGADIRPERVRNAAERAGLEVVLLEIYESPRRALLRERSPWLGRAFDLAITAGNTVARASLEASDMFLVARRRDAVDR